MPIIDINLTPEQKAAVANNVNVAMGISSSLENSRKNFIKKAKDSQNTSENSDKVEEFNNSLQKTVNTIEKSTNSHDKVINKVDGLVDKIEEFINFEKNQSLEQKESKKTQTQQPLSVQTDKSGVADEYIEQLSILKRTNRAIIKGSDEGVVSGGVRRLGASGYDPKNVNPGISLLAGAASALNPFSNKSLISNITSPFTERKSVKRNKNIELERTNINQEKIWLNQFGKEIEKLDSGEQNKETIQKRKQLEDRISKIQNRIERRSERLSEDLTNEVIYQQKQQEIERPNIFKRAFNIDKSRDVYKDSKDTLGMQVEETKRARPDIKASILKDVVGKESLIDAIKRNEYKDNLKADIKPSSPIKKQSIEEPIKRTYTKREKSPLSVSSVKNIASDLASEKIVFSKGGTPTNLGQYIAGTYYKLSGLEETLSKQGPAINYQEGDKSGGGLFGNMIGMASGAIAAKIAGSMLGKVAGKIPFLSKFIGSGAAKTVGKEVVEAGGKTVIKAAGKSVSKSAGKTILKKIPLIGAAAGIGFGVQRAMHGDMLGAAGEVTSGLASTVPGVGTGVSLGIDALLLGRDLSKINKKDNDKNKYQQPNIQSSIQDSSYYSDSTSNVSNKPLSSRQPVITTQSNNSIIASDVKNQEAMAELYANKIGDKLLQILRSDVYTALKTKEIRMQGTEISSATYNA